MDSPALTRDAVPCLRCGYDLRGLDPTSNCPECGLAVSFTLSPPTTLSAAPPSWARTLAIGAALFAFSLIAIPATPFLLDKLFPYVLRPTGTENDRIYRIHQGVMIGVLLLHALAIWILTVREPRTPHFSRRQLSIWVARLCSLGPAAAMAISTVLLLTGLYVGVPDLTAVLSALYAPVPALVFLHLRRLSTRIGRPRLAEHAGIVGIGLTICYAAFVVLVLIPPGQQVLGIFIAILPVACFILGYFWGLLLLLRLTVAFARAVHEARATWTHFDAATATNS